MMKKALVIPCGSYVLTVYRRPGTLTHFTWKTQNREGLKRLAVPWNAISRLGGCLEAVLTVAAGVKSRSEVVEGKVLTNLGKGRAHMDLVIVTQQWGLSRDMVTTE